MSWAPSPARRLLDVGVAVAALLLLAPLLLAVAAAVRLSSPGPALFRQVRLGQQARPFVLLKFRSMTVAGGGPQITVADDPRTTRLGRVLRATSIDELPQLWHVLRGQMTLVGPRPETPALAARYPDDCRWVLQCRPGLTGPAQLHLRDNRVLDRAAVDPEQDYLVRLVPARVRLDAGFQDDPSLGRTLRLLGDTAWLVLRGQTTTRRPRGRHTRRTT